MLRIGNETFSSHLLLGTANYPSPQIVRNAIAAAESDIITVSLRRQNPNDEGGNAFWNIVKELEKKILPNTAGCRNAKEAVNLAKMSREIFDTNWIKLEVIGDDYNLQPNHVELLKATEQLLNEGFEVFPYCTDDLFICKQLVSLGCRILMPWAAPIGSGLGLINVYALSALRERFADITLIVDAGIGRPSDACIAMEMGFDAVLLNSAVSRAHDPAQMALAFKLAVEAGQAAKSAGIIPKQNLAQQSTPLIDTPFWIQNL